MFQERLLIINIWTFTSGRGGGGTGYKLFLYSGGVPITSARGLGQAPKPAGGKLPIRIGGRLLM